jgi:dihydroflavonol-4-reductase
VILVTGGTGFLGSTLIKQLINDGRAVVAIKRANSIIPEDFRASSLIQWVDADLTDYFALEELFVNIKQVYHCAAKISYQKNDAAEMLHANIEGTRHIVNLCLQHDARLIHVSSIAALGTNKKGLPVNEADKWERDPHISNYAVSKYESELEVWRGITEGLDAVIVNPSVIMGIGSGKISSNIIFNLVNNGIKIYPPGSVGIVDVQDVAKIMIQLMNTSGITGERFILNSENISNRHLLQRIAKLLGKKEPSIEAKPFMLDIAWRVAKLIAIIKNTRPALTQESTRASAAKLAYSNEKIRNSIGYTFKPLDQTLQEITDTHYKTTT